MINIRATQWLARHLYVSLVLRLSTKPSFVIGNEERPNLLRWYLIPRNRWFNIYLHCFLRDDDDRALHDHPWPSLSLSLGCPRSHEPHTIDALAELGEVYRARDGSERLRWIGAGALVWRGPTFAHRMIVPSPGTLTIFVTGPVMREWGFHCPQGWRHWKDFTAYATGGSAGQIGRGCGE